MILATISIDNYHKENNVVKGKYYSRLLEVGLLVLLALTACGGGSSGEGITVEGLDAFSFDPATLTAQVGQTLNVTFNNTGVLEHNFVIDEFNVRLGPLQGGQTSSGSCSRERGRGSTARRTQSRYATTAKAMAPANSRANSPAAASRAERFEEAKGSSHRPFTRLACGRRPRLGSGGTACFCSVSSRACAAT